MPNVKIFNLILALPFFVAIGVALHVYAARAIKAVLWAWSPLPTGEPEAYRYERSVYATANPKMLQIGVVAMLAGLLLWGGLARNSKALWLFGLLAVAVAVVLDLLRWERVASSSNFLWYQHGLGGTVHQVAIENMGDVEVEETAASGFTLRRGRHHNQLVRLNVRLSERRGNKVVELPQTDASSGAEDVEAVANHLRLRLQRLGDRQNAQRSPSEVPVVAIREVPRAALREVPMDAPAPIAMPATPETDLELRKALKRLRKKSLVPNANTDPDSP